MNYKQNWMHYTYFYYILVITPYGINRYIPIRNFSVFCVPRLFWYLNACDAKKKLNQRCINKWRIRCYDNNIFHQQYSSTIVLLSNIEGKLHREEECNIHSMISILILFSKGNHFISKPTFKTIYNYKLNLI